MKTSQDQSDPVTHHHLLSRGEEEGAYSTACNGRLNNFRRHLVRFGMAACCLILFITFSPAKLRPYSCHKSLTPVERILLKEAPLIDGHNDFPMWIRAYYHNNIYQDNFTDTGELFGQVDFPRMHKGHLGGAFWSVYVECPKIFDDFSDEVYMQVVHDTFQQIDLVHRLAKEFPGHLQLASSADDVWEIFKHSDKISSMLGVEGLHQIGNSVSVLRLYHQLGVRYVTLTHTCHNKYADSASPDTPLHHGLSLAGEDVVREMNRAGLMVDLSHTSSETMIDALRVSSAPVIFSHSSSYSVCAHERNVSDEVLFQLQANGGVVMVTFYPEYTNCGNPAEASLSDVADHIQHIGELIGYDHLGIGSDFDGMPKGPKQLEDVSKFPDLIEELFSRGVSADDLKGLVGGNILRVLKKVELEAERLKDVKPLEDDVKSFLT